MPLYTISTREPLPENVRERVAMMITDVHCGHTGAPRTFVNVLFSHNVPLREAFELHVFGTVRGGRTDETNQAIRRDMVSQMSSLTGFAPDQIDFSMFPIRASWVMEGGAVLPEPGEEAEWLDSNHRAAE